MNTQGAANVNGDAFQAFYDTTGGATNPAYDATDYYNYAIEMPAGSTNGSIYVYDPVFCETANNKGTGDRWFSGSNGVSSFFEVYDTQNTLYDIGDDGAALASSSGLFRNIAAADTTMGGSGGSECLHVDRRRLRRRPRLPQQLVPALQRDERRRDRATSIGSTRPRRIRPTSPPSRASTARTASPCTPRPLAARPSCTASARCRRSRRCPRPARP